MLTTLARTLVAASILVASWVAVATLSGRPVAAGAAAAVLAALAMLSARATSHRAVWFNVATVVVLWTAFDWRLRATDEEADYQESFFSDVQFVLDDPLTGHRLAPGAVAHTRRSFRGETIYDVTYTTDDDGWRTVPGNRSDAGACVLVFGGSFAFGDGIGDGDTLAARLAVETAGRFTIHPFAAPGWGPQHMLALVEGGRVEESLDCTPRFAIYVTIPEHVHRAACNPAADGDPHGPRYRLDDGNPVRDGFCDDERREGGFGEAWAVSERLRRQAATQVGERDLAVYRAVVVAAQRALVARWPDLEFHVLAWRRGHTDYLAGDPAAAALAQHAVDQVLPGDEDWRERYELPHDGHPTPLANRLLAEYLTREVLTPLDSP